MIKTLKISIGYTVGVIIAIFGMSLWRNEEIDWQLMIGLLIGGFIGLIIVSGIKTFIKIVKEKASE